MTGYYYTSTNTYGFTATPQAGGPIVTSSAAIATVPEPSTWALLLAGFAGLSFAVVARRGTGGAFRLMAVSHSASQHALQLF